MLIGCIADDFTGATDLALTLTRGGMRTVQVIGVPEQGELPEADAVVVALKSRTAPVRNAVSESLTSADRLLAGGARQLFFKYCSTFDSTDEGNIGPVAEALLERLGVPLTIACPAFPTNKRTIYQGHLFVGDQLLSDSPMKDHPLTPMRDANLVRVLQRQTRLKVGLIAVDVVEQGPEAIRAELAKAEQEGIRIAIVDALNDRHLLAIGEAAADLGLITGGSGVAIGLPENFRRRQLLRRQPEAKGFAVPKGRAVILSGSCSAATREQVARAEAAGLPALRIAPDALASGAQNASAIAQWCSAQDETAPVLVYGTAAPDEVAKAQASLGREKAAQLVEQALAETARALVDRGATRIIVAGGDTSGAVVAALGVRALAIGPEIDPGVPWTRSLGEPEIALALKSGNFGAPDFFIKAWEVLA